MVMVMVVVVVMVKCEKFRPAKTSRALATSENHKATETRLCAPVTTSLNGEDRRR